MKSKILSLLALAASALLVACAEPQVRPAPDSSTTVKPQSEPTGQQGGPVQVDPELRKKLIVLLSGIEHMPSKEEFARLGTEPQLIAALQSVVADPAAAMYQRTQAAAGLGFYPQPEARQTLEDLLNSASTDPLLRRPALKAYAHAFGPEAVPLVSKMLEHPDRNTREAAVRALAAVGTPAARKAIEARVNVEPDAALKTLSQETLTRWK